MSDLHGRIASLEGEIEGLAAAAERSRTIMKAAQVAIAAGALTLAAMTVGLLRFEPLAFVIGVAAVLAGIALYGSSRRTLDDTLASVRAHEARRAEMIDALGLETVEARS